MAIPLLMVVDFPASPKISGIMHDTPKPVSTKPMDAGIMYGKRLAINSPEKMQRPLYFKMVLVPNFGTILSPKNLPVVIQTMYKTKAAVAVSFGVSTAFLK